MRMEERQGTVSAVLSVIAYLRGFFGEDAFAASRADGTAALRKTPESAKFVEWAAAVEAHGSEIHKVVLGIYNSAHVLVEVYGINTRAVGDLRRICLHLQRMGGLGRRVSVRLKVYSHAPLSMEGFRSGNEHWNMDLFEEASVEGVTVYRNTGAGSTAAPSFPDKSDGIRCTCLINSNDGDMIQCDGCHSWLHTVCAGFFSNQDRRIPGVYTCLYCSGGLSTGERNASIYRRALGVIYNENFSTGECVRGRLGITSHFSKVLLKRLREDGFVAVRGRGCVAVRNNTTREKIKEYFNGRRAECSISAEEIELDTAF